MSCILLHDKKFIFSLAFILLINQMLIAQTGIGTTSPVNKFQVEATTADPATSGTAANGNLRLGGLSVVHVLDFGLSSSSNFAWLQARSKSAYGTTYPIALNPNGGAVGIGTSAPSSTLTVGNTGGTIGGEILLNPTSTQYEGGQIILKRSLVGSTVDWTIDQYGSSSANARFRIFNGASESNGISILENGKIGMGLADPLTLLHLQNNNSIGTGDPGNNVLPSIYIYNTNAASSTAHSILALRTNGSGGGNPYLSFDINGVRGYSVGIDNADGDKLKFHTNWSLNNVNTPALTLTSDGKFGIGTSSPGRSLQVQSSENTSVYVESTSTDNNGLMILNANTDQNWTFNYHEFIYFQKQGNNIGAIIAANNGAGVSFNTSSDYRLKTDLRNYSGIDLVNKIKTYDFSWKANNSRMHGVMAHELQEILPYAVSGSKDAIDENGKMVPQGVDYGKITPILVKAIQEQDEVINNLKKDKERLELSLKDIQERLLKLENQKK
jgi:hypothetical protein